MSGPSDHWNPIFLKEVRQAMRGRVFGVLFPTTVLAGVAVAIHVMVDLHPRPIRGPDVFMPVLTVLGVAALGLVPFSAFQSMAGEWDEGTHDLLVLSHLSPGRIVLGKLLTAAVESALYFSSFLPVLLFTFLLSGVDVRDIVFLVGALYGASIAMSAVALSLAGVTRIRFWRVVMLAALAGIGFLALIGGHELAEQFVARGRGLGTTYATDDVLATIALIVGVGCIAAAFAATRVAHPEDDRSGPVRYALTALFVLTLAAILAVSATLTGTPPVFELAAVLSVCAAIPAVFFVTEPERLPRRTVTRVPRNPLWALCATPFLPGGGRGVLWWMLQLLILATWATVFDAWLGGRAHDRWNLETIGRWLAFQAHFLVYLAGISLALGRLRERPYGVLAARLLLPSIAVLSMVLPILVRFFAGDPTGSPAANFLDPFRLMQSSGTTGQRVVATLAGVLVLAANAPRLRRAVAEVLEASAARRRSRARHALGAPHVA